MRVQSVKHGITGVALLGTNLLEEHKRFLCHNFDKVVVALDPDALQKTLQIRKELQSWVRTVMVLRLTDDIKYEEDIDINKYEGDDMELALLRSLMSKKFYEDHRARCPNRLFSKDAQKIKVVIDKAGYMAEQ